MKGIKDNIITENTYLLRVGISELEKIMLKILQNHKVLPSNGG
jgi:hypothetical protein